MPRYANVPGPTIRRLSLYLRQLEAVRSSGQGTVSSKQLGEPLRVTDAQVRKDLAYFGQFGRPGIGYRVAELIAQARRILGTDRPWRSILVGAGNLGRALISYRGFAPKGFNIVAVFDGDDALVGQTIRASDGLTILPMSKLPEVARKEKAQIGFLAVPADAAQSVTDLMLQAGVQGILNFAPVALRVPPTVPVASVDLTINLEQLSFQIRELLE